MYLLTVAIITMCAELVSGQIRPCTTLDDKTSYTCISILKCEPVRKLLHTPQKTAHDLILLTELLTKVNCGYYKYPFVPQVCCNPDDVIKNGTCIGLDDRPGKCIGILLCPYLGEISCNCFYGTSPTDEKRSGCEKEVWELPLKDDSKCCTTAGGHSTDILYQQPWALLIEYELKNSGTDILCAGTLISTRYALTAAHCTTGVILDIAKPTLVLFGEYDLNQKGKDCVSVDGAGEQCNDGVIRIEIERTIPHPEYEYLASKQNDIAVIRFRQTAPYTDFIRPICLPTKNLESSPPDSPLVAVSWYKDEDNKDIKRIVEVPFVDQEKCKMIYSTRGRSANFSKTICTGGIKSKGTCAAVGGGPLVHENQEEGRSELIGIVSFERGRHCDWVFIDKEDIPSVYTNVYDHISFIRSNLYLLA